MAKAKAGDKVKVHYTGTLDDGSVFDSSEGRDPLEFELGNGQVIKGFNDGITGMEVGEEKEVKIDSKDAYGDHNPELIRDVPKEGFNDFKPEVGMVIGMQVPGMPQQIPAKVVEVKKNTVKLDLNPPLAGQNLTFKIKLEEIA